jgi:hypothetical protein
MIEAILMQCSGKKLRLRESSSLRKTNEPYATRMVRPPKKFRHAHEEKTAVNFYKLQLLPAEIEVCLSLGSIFVQCFDGECLKNIKLKISSGCIRVIDLEKENSKIVMDAGWLEFVKAHDLKVVYFDVFKNLDNGSKIGITCVRINQHNWNNIKVVVVQF